MRRLLPIALAVVLTGLVPSPQAPQIPPVPWLTQFSYWDHHWVQWLPTHPVYESIEAQSFTPDAGRPERRLIRILLTERAAPKRQIVLLNDSASARAYRADAHFRTILLDVGGPEGGARDMALTTTDDTGQPIEWRLRFRAGQRLTTQGAGWGAQQGHGAGATYLYRYRGPGATTVDSRLLLGGGEYPVNARDPAPQGYHAGYVQGAWAPVIILGAPLPVVITTQGFAMGQGRSFRFLNRGDDGLRFESGRFGFDGHAVVDMRVTALRGLDSYTQRLGRHSFTIMFDPALAWEAGTHRFAVQVDEKRDVITGTVEAVVQDSALTLTWRHDAPWTRDFAPYRSVLRPTAGGYELLVSPGAAAPR